MKRILPLLFTLSLAPLAFADEPAPPVAPAPDAAPTVDPAASALLQKSAQAYSDLNGLSLHFAATKRFAGKTTKTSGDILLAKPNKAKVEITTPDGTTQLISDGATLWTQMPTKPASYKSEGPGALGTIPPTVGRANNLVGVPLSSLLQGRSFLDLGYHFESVSSPAANVVKLSTRPRPGAAAQTSVFTLTFDSSTSLLNEVEVASTSYGKTTATSTIFSAFQPNPTPAPSAFTYTPAADVKPYVEPPPYDARLVVGADPFPLLTRDDKGKKVSWKKYKGKVVLLDFWATWCGPCVAELPNVMKNYDKYHDKGFEVIGISLDEQREPLTAFIKARDMKYLNLYDDAGGRSNPDAKAYGVRFIPFTLLIGKDGKIAAVNEGGEKLATNIEAALAK